MERMLGSIVIVSFLCVGLYGSDVFAQNVQKQAKKIIVTQKKAIPKKNIPIKKQVVKKPIKLKIVKTAPKAKPKVKKSQEEIKQEINTIDQKIDEKESVNTSGEQEIKQQEVKKEDGIESQEKEKKLDDTKAKLEALKKKLGEIKKIEPVEVKKFESPNIKITPPKVSNPWTDSYPGEDKTMRDYYKEHPGSYEPPLLKYNLPSGIF